MKLYFLGTCGASTVSDRDNTSFFIESGTHSLLIDCAGSPGQKLLRLQKNPNDLNLVLLTHLHTDHCYGLPSLLFHMFLNNRSTPLLIGSPAEEFSILETQLKAHNLFPIARIFAVDSLPISDTPDNVIWESATMCIRSTPVSHGRPCRAFRIDEKQSNQSIVISGDTRPSENLVKLAKDATLLIHEASFLEINKELAELHGHSTSKDAGNVAESAGVSHLALVHFDFNGEFNDLNEFQREAQQQFHGQVFIPEDMSCVDI
ncbi:MBL fold metallo-hydrolase, partial [bacterium]|nr:MBL fold metallo-hydrolase [candidate division CSSED10-310 bacterium]